MVEAMENHLPHVPAHLISLAGEPVVRMRVDPTAAHPLARPLTVPPGEARPFATIDIESLKASIQIGTAPY